MYIGLEIYNSSGSLLINLLCNSYHKNYCIHEHYADFANKMFVKNL